jgi:peptidyl-prolyl cis-trans isomerase A (cyclophilin A)
MNNPFLSKIVMLTFVILMSASYSCTNMVTISVLISTSEGDIFLNLDKRNAPLTTNNFIHLCEEEVYSAAIFYRTVNDENQAHNKIKIDVIQGGLFHDSLVNEFAPIPHETTFKSGILHMNGTISMARNEPGSASTEFFICIGDQPELDFGGLRNPDGQGFSAFGSVTKGMDVVHRIHQARDTGQYLVEPVIIKGIKILNK